MSTETFGETAPAHNANGVNEWRLPPQSITPKTPLGRQALGEHLSERCTCCEIFVLTVLYCVYGSTDFEVLHQHDNALPQVSCHASFTHVLTVPSAFVFQRGSRPPYPNGQDMLLQLSCVRFCGGCFLPKGVHLGGAFAGGRPR